MNDIEVVSLLMISFFNGLIKSQTTSLNLSFVLTDCKSLSQDHTGQAPPCDMTEKRIFTMGAQIGSALVR